MFYLHYSKYPDISIPYHLNLCSFILNASHSNHDHPAFIDDSNGETLTHTDLVKLVNGIASGLVNILKLKRGDVLAIFSSNHINYAALFLAACSVGIIVTTINPAYTETELGHQLSDSKATALFTIPSLFPLVTKTISTLSFTMPVISLDRSSTPTSPPSLNTILSELPYQILEFQSVDECKNEVALIAYSSGTTGKPKGVMTSHYNEMANTLQCELALNKLIKKGKVVLGLLPFFHCYGIQVLLLISVRALETVVVVKKFDFNNLLKSIQTHRIAALFLAPPVILAMAKSPDISQYDLSSIEYVFSGAAPLPEEVSNLAGQRFKALMLQGYGMTEASPVVSMVPVDSKKNDSVGILVSSMVAKICDLETNHPLPTNQVGELWVKGPNIMKGYLNNEKATKDMFDLNGFMRTGDIGYFDENERLFIVDRAKELIKYKGFQVAPAELEAHLLSQPQVSDCCVIGIPDPSAGEVPKAFIVLKTSLYSSESPLSHEAVLNQIKNKAHANLAYYKHFRGGMEIVDSIPKSPSGKILRRMIRDQEVRKRAKAKL